MNNHTDEIQIIKKIDAYLKGELSADEAEELWVEIIKQPKYLEYLETEMAVKSHLEGPSEPTLPRVGESIRNSWRWIAAAASVLLLVVALNLFTGGEEKEIHELALSDISIAEHLAAPEVIRSQDSGLTGADSLMNVGFQAALSGDLDEAVSIYEQVIDDYSDSGTMSQAYLNIGIIRFNDGDYEKSIRAFNQTASLVEQNKILKEKAFWYQGNAYLHLKRLEEAREAIEAAYRMGGIYRKPAFRLLRKLDYELDSAHSDDFNRQRDN